MKKYFFSKILLRYFDYLMYETFLHIFAKQMLWISKKKIYRIYKFMAQFSFPIVILYLRYELYLKEIYFWKYKKWFLEKIRQDQQYIEKGYKYKNLGIYLKDLVSSKNYKNLYYQNLTFLNNFYCYLLIRLNRKNLFLTLLNNEGNVLCKTNIGASGFKKKVKRTGYAIKGTGKNFVKIIKQTLLKNIFILYKDINNNVKNKIVISKLIKNKKKLKNIKRKKLKKLKKEKKLKIIILKKKNKKIIRSKLLWVKIFKNLQKYRNYYSLLNLNNLIKKNLRIIFRIKTSLKLWAFRFVVYGLFKKLPWFRGLEFRLPIAHSNSLRLKKKRRV